ncbi:MAG: hypothetical protein ACJAYB_003451 [Psychromonas sp.]|jgi:hypothetical protein
MTNIGALVLWCSLSLADICSGLHFSLLFELISAIRLIVILMDLQALNQRLSDDI